MTTMLSNHHCLFDASNRLTKNDTSYTHCLNAFIQNIYLRYRVVSNTHDTLLFSVQKNKGTTQVVLSKN